MNQHGVFRCPLTLGRCYVPVWEKGARNYWVNLVREC